MKRLSQFTALLVVAAIVVAAQMAPGAQAISDRSLMQVVGGVVTCDYPQPAELQDEYKCEYCVSETSELWNNCNPKTAFFCSYLQSSGPTYRPECFTRDSDCGGKYLLWTDEDCTISSAIQGVDCDRQYANDTAGGSGGVINCP